MLPSIINIHQGIQNLWTGHDLHRQTDRRTDEQTKWFLYTPWTSFVGGGSGTSSLTKFVTLNLYFILELFRQCGIVCFFISKWKPWQFKEM